MASPLAGTLSSIKVKEGDTVEVGALLGEVNEGKIISKKTTKIEPVEAKKQSYIPPKKSKKKKLKEKEEETLTLEKEEETLTKNVKDENSNETLVLATLAEENNGEKEEAKYIPPKTKKNLSPAVRKMVEENDIDVSNIEGTGKSGRISKGDLINLMGYIPQPSKRNTTHGPE